jgi:phage shock protein C
MHHHRTACNSRAPRSPRDKLYRSRSGVIFGVCQGIAEYLDLSPFWVRVGTVILAIFMFQFTIPAYIILALVLKPEPVLPIENDEDADFYDSYVHTRQATLRQLKRTFDALDRRIQRMESIVTAREYDWESRLSD